MGVEENVRFIVVEVPSLYTGSGSLYDWQTLIAGFLALMGAGFTVGCLVISLRFEKQKHKELLEKEARYNRSRLPDAVVELKHYIYDAFQYFRYKSKRTSDEIEMPTRPSLQVIQDNIKTVDLKTAEVLSELCSFFQIFGSRLKGYKTEDENTTSLNDDESLVRDMCLLTYYLDQILMYGRKQIDSVQGTENKSEKLLEKLRDLYGPNAFVADVKHEDEYKKLYNLLKQYLSSQSVKKDF